MAITKITFNTSASKEVQAEELFNFFNTYGKKYFDTIELTEINTLTTIDCTININSNYAKLRMQYVSGYWRGAIVSDIHENTWNNTTDLKFKFGVVTSKGIAIQYTDSIYNFQIIVITKTKEGNTFIYMPVNAGSYKTPKWIDMKTGAYGGLPQFGAGSYLYYFTGNAAGVSLVPFLTETIYAYTPYFFRVMYSNQDGKIYKMTLNGFNYYTNGSVALLE